MESKFFFFVFQMAENISYTYITLWTTTKFGFQHSDIKKEKKYFYRVSRFQYRSKTQFFSFLNLLVVIWNARLLQRVAFLRYFIALIRNSKLLHVACSNIPQIEVTKTLRPFQATILFLLLHLYIVIYHNYTTVQCINVGTGRGSNIGTRTSLKELHH